jgi:hypothetical protein
MATIVRHPDVDDYIMEMTLPEIAARPNGIADLFEQGKLIILKDFRLDFDFEALARLDQRTDVISDPKTVRKLKKASSTMFFEGDPPVRVLDKAGTPRYKFSERIRQAMFDSLCQGDIEIFHAASAALEKVHHKLQSILATCFPSYKADRLLPNLRLTETLFENLHWDVQSLATDYHQARVFCNLDKGKRIWNVSHNFIEYMKNNYDTLGLSRFRGQDPDTMVHHICKTVLGGTNETWRDTFPRHKISFDPGEVWLGESRIISHQIYYGQRAAVYMWIVDYSSMHDSNNRFCAQIEAVHAAMSLRKKNDAVAAKY